MFCINFIDLFKEEISAGCISKTDGTRRGGEDMWIIRNETLTTKEIVEISNKQCLKKMIETLDCEENDVMLCICDDKDFCNIAFSTNIDRIALILIGVVILL